MPFDLAADWTPMLVIVAALGVGGLVKGATGMGLPLVAIPVLATAFSVPDAVALMTVPILVTNAWQLASLRASLAGGQVRFLLPMLSAGAIGVVLGTGLLVSLDERWLMLALAALLFGYVGLRLAHPDFRIGPRAGTAAAAPVGLAAGVLHGATGISAPIGVTFIHAMRFDRDTHVFAVSAMFGLFAVTQTVTLTYAGVLTGPRWLESGVALLPTAVAMPLGTLVGRRFSRAAFDRVILALLAISAVTMLHDALS